MFGVFKKKLSLNESASTAEILTVAENGDYQAFIIRTNESSEDFSAMLKREGGEKALTEFVEIVDNRIETGDFENVFDVADEMALQYGLKPEKRNKNVERFVVCGGSKDYSFKWNPSD
jgi:hypothetical protein